jgi:thymidylate synthase (FAD)
MQAKIKVLDQGSICEIQHWGSDELIIRAARQSTDGAFRGWDRWECDEGCEIECPHPSSAFIKGDNRFIKFLWCKKHSVPFEHCGLTVEVKAPLLTFREWHRHRTQSYSEMSARYVPMKDENWHPTVARIVEGAASAGANKQARGVVDRLPNDAEAELWLTSMRVAYMVCRESYELGLSLGIQKEVCRTVLNQGQYSQMWASANLLNWLRFLTLRAAGDAQEEIRVYADQVCHILWSHFPHTMEAFELV